MQLELIKAMAVGICVAAPIGPVLMIVIQKTLRRGHWAGTVAGIGSALIDTVYAAIGLYALTMLKGFIDRETPYILLFGGILVCLLGLMMALKDSTEKLEEGESHFTMVGYAVQTAGCALSNPAAIAVMMAFLSVFHLNAQSLSSPVWAVLLFVFLGEMFYWFCLSLAIGKFMRVRPRTIRIFSKICGAAIVAFGIVLIVKGVSYFI